MMKKLVLQVISCIVCFACAAHARATESENLNLQVLPAPGKVTIDGKFDDWDLTGGIFACADVENARGAFAVWFHAMYDHDNLYLLARWSDPTPMNNPGSTKGDNGFNGDCLQFRVVTAPDVAAAEVSAMEPKDKDAPAVRTSHLTCWRDKDGLDVIDLSYGRGFKEGALRDAKSQGAAQAFAEYPDRTGYVQEIAIPWKLLVKPGVEVKTGSTILMTLEPNFTVGTGGRLTIKDLFKSGSSIDRVFTFQSNMAWGFAKLEPKGYVPLRPVRLADRREFPVHMQNGLPVVDWAGLVKNNLPTGFKPIRFTMPQPGFVSLNLFAPDGTVVRQLLTGQFFEKGEQAVEWDGLTTPSYHRPGQAASAGEYSWQGFYHGKIGMKLRGWAGNSGPAPWAGWGADHGNPMACAAAGDQIILGWNGGEGDKPLQACDLNSNIQWKSIRGGIASAGPVATDGATVYAFNCNDQYVARSIYRVDAKSGKYTEWSALGATDLTMKDLWGDVKDLPAGPSGLAADRGRVFVSFSEKNKVLVVDAATGQVTKQLEVAKPSALVVGGGKLYCVSRGAEVAVVDFESGASHTVAKPTLVEAKDWVSAVAIDKAGNLYLGIRGQNHHVQVFSADGKPTGIIGRKAGRELIGPWTPDGMFNIAAMAIDSVGKLWVAEDDACPKRVSVWDTVTRKFHSEHFGSASYGAIGSAINPTDPYLMVGQGCEWRIDPKTGLAACLGVISREGMGASRFGFGQNGHLYLAVTAEFLTTGPVRIFERLGDARYKLRAMLRRVENDDAQAGKKGRRIEVWSDANDDAQEQSNEVQSYAMDLGGWLQGWYMPMTPDLTFYGSRYQVKVTGWTPCGAPQYDLTKAKKMAGPTDNRGGMGAQMGHGSVDGRYMLYNAGYGEDYSTMDCYDIDTGRLMWTYPSNFTGVHGSHRACGPVAGMIRGAYDITGAAKLPPPLGNIWVVPTNKGEWHVLTENGFYLTKLFESDPLKVNFPASAAPGVDLDACPPGAGEEAFGGSISQSQDGKLSIQAGHISFWNAEVTGLETVHALSGGKVSLTDEDSKSALKARENVLQEEAKGKSLVIRQATPNFTSDLNKDFSGAEIVSYQKDDATAIRSVASWDKRNLYVGWEVKDPTPWINGAEVPEDMYLRGDTVDFQLGTDPKAPKGRTEAALGDLRVSIGPYHGKPTVVVYRKIAADKHPKIFSSGVVKNYEMQSVIVLPDAKLQVTSGPSQYVVEVALPMTDLGISPVDGLRLLADFGATHGDKAGQRTVLRTHWSNQNTGLVSDAVYELQMTPAAWGEIELKRK